MLCLIHTTSIPLTSLSEIITKTQIEIVDCIDCDWMQEIQPYNYIIEEDSKKNLYLRGGLNFIQESKIFDAYMNIFKLGHCSAVAISKFYNEEKAS